MQFDYAVIIGRFQPFHNGHLHCVLSALKVARKVIIVVGSHKTPPSIRNPWTSTARAEMIRQSLEDSEIDPERISFGFVEDKAYQDQEWLVDVQKEVLEKIHGKSPSQDSANSSPKICLVGADKDETTYYMNFFRGIWTVIDLAECNEAGNPHSCFDMNATEIRRRIFSELWNRQSGSKPHESLYINSLVPPRVLNVIQEWIRTESAERLLEEWKYVASYKTLLQGSAQWPVQILTADAVVIQNGHVLMVKRGGHPGKGLWALPGGHVNTTETFEDAAIRELLEETGLKVPEKVIRGSIKESRVFDSPNRSVRGRVITVSYSIHLEGGPRHPLPRVSAGDDAAEAWWFPISQIFEMRQEIFEDHLDIIRYFISRR